ncbi:MAG: DUF5716 family protein [Lachnospiraceae bacterium]|nr:DUF5716 family protein [Lachnospiraceae bacterium]
MLDDIKDSFNKISKQRVVVGFDLSDEFSMISYFPLGEDEPISVSVTPGGEDICVPTVVCKYFAENAWAFGNSAIEAAKDRKGTIVSGLLSQAREGRPVRIENKDYDPVDLLALFMKKCFSLLSQEAPIEKVSVISITVDRPDAATIEILSRAIETLRIKPEKVFYQSHSESAFYYMINQNRELWNHDAIICHLSESGLYVRTMKKNVHTSPIVVLMDEKNFDHIKSEDLYDAPVAIQKQKDTEFWYVLQGLCEGTHVSSLFLLGDAFSMDWWKESLAYVSKKCRVFRGNNLFSKGAAYGAREILDPTKNGESHVYLGKDKVKANVGMRVIRDGEEVYMALLDAGKNWYETKRECELILEHEEVLSFIVTPLNGRNVKTAQMYLTGIPLRPGKSTRIHLELKMLSERKLLVSAIDMGFGEFYEASGLMWNTEIVLE